MIKDIKCNHKCDKKMIDVDEFENYKKYCEKQNKKKHGFFRCNWRHYKTNIIGYALGYWSFNIIIGTTKDVSNYGWLLLGWIITYIIFHKLLFKNMKKKQIQKNRRLL